MAEKKNVDDILADIEMEVTYYDDKDRLIYITRTYIKAFSPVHIGRFNGIEIPFKFKYDEWGSRICSLVNYFQTIPNIKSVKMSYEIAHYLTQSHEKSAS